MRRNPAQFAAMMDANPQLGAMLASVFSPEQLSQMFADVGFSQGEGNPPPPPQPSLAQAMMMGGGRGMGMGMPMAQGGLVDMPGYYERGGRSPYKPLVSSDVAPPLRYARPPPPPRDLLDIGKALRGPPYTGPPADYSNSTSIIGDRWHPSTLPPGSEDVSVLSNYPAPLRIRPQAWESFLAAQPPSTNIERRDLSAAPPPPDANPGSVGYDLKWARGGLVPLHRAVGGLSESGIQQMGSTAQQRAQKVLGDFPPFTTPTFQRGGLTIPAMNTEFKQAHFGGLNTRQAETEVMGRAPGVHLINSHVPGRVDRIPMRARTGSYIVPAHAVSGMGQGNTMAGAKMWGDAISKSIGPMGIQNAIKARAMKAPSLRMPSPPLNPKTGIGRGAFVGFAEGGDAGDDGEYTPIITAGGELVIDPEIVEALGRGDAEEGKRMLANSVKLQTSQTVGHLKKLPGPVE